MKYLLDTNICIYIIKQKPRAVIEKFSSYRIGEIAVSSITVAELEYGVQKSRWPDRNQTALHQFLLPLQILPFDQPASAEYGKLRAELESQGTPIGSFDLLIAAHALSANLTLVSNNVREFGRIPTLPLENWV